MKREREFKSVKMRRRKCVLFFCRMRKECVLSSCSISKWQGRFYLCCECRQSMKLQRKMTLEKYKYICKSWWRERDLTIGRSVLCVPEKVWMLNWCYEWFDWARWKYDGNSNSTTEYGRKSYIMRFYMIWKMIFEAGDDLFLSFCLAVI